MPNKLLAIGFNVPFKEAIDFTKNRGVVLPEKYYGELQGIHRTLNYSIAGVASLDQLQAVLDSLEQALSVGKTFNEWQKDVRVQDLSLPKHRLDNIYRTNIQTAYNRGRWEQQVENKKSQPYLMYDAINDSRVRPSHLAMDGIIRPVGDSFWDSHYPPNGYRCRCRCIALSQSQAEARSKDTTNKDGSIKKNGLNQAITPEMKPDKGWDYNVGEDLTAGIEKAVAERIANERINRVLLSAFKEKAMQQIPEKIAAETLLENLIERAKSSTGGSTLADLWSNEKKYTKHVEKRLLNDDIADELDYQNKTFNVLANAESMTVAISTASNMISGKMQLEIDGWIVILAGDGSVVTSYPREKSKLTFEQNHTSFGDEIYEYAIIDNIRENLKKLFS